LRQSLKVIQNGKKFPRMTKINQWQHRHQPQVELNDVVVGRVASLPVQIESRGALQSVTTIESLPTRQYGSIVGTTISVLLTASLVLLVGISPSIAQAQKPARTLTASGRGVVTIPTTLSQIRLAIEVSAKTPTQAQQEAARRSIGVINYLKTQQLEKLQTTGINLSPSYTYPPNGNPQLTGYTASNSISFRVTTDRAGAILDAAVKNGATRIDGVSFVASEQAIATAQLQALKQATQDAQRQADTVLETLNFKRKEVIGVQINSASTPAPVPFAQDAMQSRSVAAPATPIIGGEQQVEAAVTLDIRY
jgi:uncharacterized protein